MILAWRKRLIGVIALALAGISLLTYAWRHQEASPAVILHSQAPDQAVRVPFKLVGGLIYVHALLDRKPMQCIVDTGTDAIIVPSRAGVSGADTGAAVGLQSLAGPGTQARRIVLPLLQLGDYELREAPAIVTPDSPSPNHSLSHGVPTLGDDAFRHIVLTIDYARRELVLRQPQYDFTTGGNVHQGGVMKFCHNTRFPNLPCVAGTVQGNPTRLLLDTGFGGSYIGITPRIEGKAIPQYGMMLIGHRWVRTNAREYFESINSTLTMTAGKRTFDLMFQSPAVVFPNIPGGFGADFGTALLENFCVTIDYGRRRILLERNAAPKEHDPK